MSMEQFRRTYTIEAFGQPLTFTPPTEEEIFVSEAVDLLSYANDYFGGLVLSDMPEDFSHFPEWWKLNLATHADDAHNIEAKALT